MAEYLDTRDSVLYDDFTDEFSDYAGYLAASEGPTSEIDMKDSRVSLTEADIAIASHLGRQVEEAADIDWRNVLESGVEGLGALGFTGQFLRSGDPAWLSPAVILGYLSKEDVGGAYGDLREARNARKKMDSSVSSFRKDYPGIDGYTVTLDEIDEDADVSAVRPEDMGEGLEDVLGSEQSR